MADASPNPRLVITGMGAVTNLGLSAPETWSAMREGRSGISLIDDPAFERFGHFDWRVTIAGQVRGWDPETDGVLERRDFRRFDRCTMLGLTAAHEAIASAGIDFSKEDPERCGVVVGSGIGGIATIEEMLGVLIERGPDRISPHTVPRLMVNATAGNISIRYGLRGPSSAHATACASSGHAFGDAMHYLRIGEADVMVVGGCEAAITPLCIGAFSTMRALSMRNDDPTRASRPFDKLRDGFVLAEGAAFCVVETLEHARARGAEIHAELLGYGNSSDAAHITAPDDQGRGASASMRKAMRMARLEPEKIDYINAHGTSTPIGDDAEVAAVLSVFGEHARKSRGGRLLMSSTKSMHGHALGASGSVEMVACVNAVKTGVVPPTINLDHPDESFDIDLVPHEARERPIRYAMNNTFGFGGHNVTLIVGRFEG